MSAWTFKGYWNTVLGATRTAADVVNEFDLTGDERGLDEWLGTAEAAAWSAGGHRGDLPEEWSLHHTCALAELVAAAAEG